MSSRSCVHADENWRQRLRAEQAAVGQWRDELGFLEQPKPAGSMHVDPQIPNRHLSRTIAEQGIMYPFLEQTHRASKGEGDESSTSTSRFDMNTTRTYTAPASTRHGAIISHSHYPTSGIATQKVWRGDPIGETQHGAMLRRTRTNAGGSIIGIASTTRQLDQTKSSLRHSAPLTSTTATATAPIIPTLSLPAIHAPSSPSRDSTSEPKLLHLDRSLAQTLTPRYSQDVGGCVWTSGVDPQVKYRHPLLSSHKIGWGIHDASLEFFGIGQHAHRDLTTKRLYGWD